MKLVLREYLRILKEDGELDCFLADILFFVGFELLSKPQKGAKQFGVDIAAVGEDPEDGKRKLFLFVIKAGDFNRSSWNSGKVQDIRPSLDQIFDVYLNTHVDKVHRDLPKKIIVCAGGELKQAVRLDWVSYTKTKSKNTGVEFDFWGGEHLSNMSMESMLGHNMLPADIRQSLWKTLALINQPGYDMAHFFNLIETVFSVDNFSGFSGKKLEKALKKVFKQIHLCLHILFVWGKEENNVKPAYLAAERVLLKAWGLLHQLSLCDKKVVVEEYHFFGIMFLKIGSELYDKIGSLCGVRDGLSHFRLSDEFEYPLRVFDIMGIFGVIGLTLLSFTDQESSCDNIATTLMSLVSNNMPSRTPLYDSHAIDIYLAMSFLLLQGHKEFVFGWLREIISRIPFAYEVCGRHFPIWTDSYEDLLKLKQAQGEERERQKQELTKTSTLIPILAVLCVALELDEMYEELRDLIQKVFPHTDLQIWYPDETTEEKFYLGFAGFTGATLPSFEFPTSVAEFREKIAAITEIAFDASCFSCFTHGMPFLAFLANRHFRTPVLPSLLQGLCVKVT